jgi:multimeric flavodoxin WrbA
MNAPPKVLAIIGSYRKGGIIDRAIDEVLAAARAEGAEIGKIHLAEKRIEYCANCRVCTQQPGLRRGKCIIDDEMDSILAEIERADGLVLGSPMNFGTVTAVMKTFIERLICFSYWPWGVNAPRVRNERKGKRAVVVASSAAPALVARYSTGIVSLLKQAADLLGARTVGVLCIGLAAREQRQDIGLRAKKKARRLGKLLAS